MPPPDRYDLTCVHCGSKDLWQPFVPSTLDRFLLRFGVALFDCRKCRTRQYRRVSGGHKASVSCGPERSSTS